ncbi:glutamyl-tRNA reductase-binding protein [Citrus sinensis]|uniref:Glutamyl-tRNA reductase-binding protein n=1 Tax=Citrus sinensis TaxID=2711 RepID=A0ACB8JES1_CITSI|nr:glutamyl-tRNA reductase-binding protein [Citrus sinensis]
MLLQTQSLTLHFLPPLIPFKPIAKPQFIPCKQIPFRKLALKCSVSTVSCPTTHVGISNDKPFPAEASRTIMELSSIGTLSMLTSEGCPLGVGVRFAVDDEGTPVLCFSDSCKELSVDKESSLHVQLNQCGLRTPQCTIQGVLGKPKDRMISKRLLSMWKRRFGEDVNEELIYVVAVERVLQMEDFAEDGIWVSSSDYRNASPDPLRHFAEKIVNEINLNNMEDVYRFCNIYVDLDFQVLEAKMIWVDRLGFDVRISCPQKGLFDVRIPFPTEVTDEKGAKDIKKSQDLDLEYLEKSILFSVFERSFLAEYELELAQLDVKTSFLYGDLEEEIYMTQPCSFKVARNENHSTIALSTMEAEYMEATKAIKEVIWLKGLLGDLGVIQENIESQRCSYFGDDGSLVVSSDLDKFLPNWRIVKVEKSTLVAQIRWGRYMAPLNASDGKAASHIKDGGLGQKL